MYFEVYTREASTGDWNVMFRYDPKPLPKIKRKRSFLWWTWTVCEDDKTAIPLVEKEARLRAVKHAQALYDCRGLDGRGYQDVRVIRCEPLYDIEIGWYDTHRRVVWENGKWTDGPSWYAR